MLMQESAFAADDYQSLRQELVDAMRSQVVALNDKLFSVRRHRCEVEKYRRVESFQLLTPTSFAELKSPISMLAVNDEADVDALRSDALMYGYMIAACQALGGKTAGYKSRLISIAACLQKVATIPQVKDKLPLIDEVFDGQIFDDANLLDMEGVRKELRGLIRFIVSGKSRRDVITHLDDSVTRVVYGVEADIGEDFEDYKLKVERYLKDCADTLVIHKLRNNQPMTEFEFEQLEWIFTHDLGNAEDYAKTYGDTPFGLLVRRLVHLDRDAAMAAFANFLNDQSLNEQQISFVKRVVNYVVENGYMEPVALTQPPFDRPQSFIRMFNSQQQLDLMAVIRGIKRNAEQPAA